MNLDTSRRKIQLLVTVKTYPVQSKTYGELVCTAGIDLITKERIRLYPVPFRYLDDRCKYEKYDIIELEVQKNTKDIRKESYRPVDIHSVKVIGKMTAENRWLKRNSLLIPKCTQNLCEMNKEYQDISVKWPSLWIIKPKELQDFYISSKTEWLVLIEETKQLTLEWLWPKPIPLYKIPTFKYKFTCMKEGCAWHNVLIEDWELWALYRKCLGRSGDDTVNALEKTRQKFLSIFSEKKDLFFFVGTNGTFHNQWWWWFMIIWAYYPPKGSTSSLQIWFF